MMKFKPMLAGKADLKTLQYPVYASAKLDGVRASTPGDDVVSRKLEVFPNKAAQRFAKWKGVDGELIVGSPTDPQVRNTTSGTLNRKTDVADGLRFYVFDLINSSQPFEERLKMLETFYGAPKTEDDPIVVPHTLIENERQLLEYEEFKLSEGYEGLILRAPGGPYKHGRSTTKEGWMLKLKRFEDAEAMVIMVNEEMRNDNEAKKDKLGRTKRSKAQEGLVGKGRAGELLVVGTNGKFKDVEFTVPLGGAGDVGKAWWWERDKAADAIGRIITYRYFPKGVKDKPLLPTYVGLRERGQ